MGKSERPKRKDVDAVDFISNMPDEILVLILSRLHSTKEEIRTCVLSRRWRYVWNSTPSISISAFSFNNSLYVYRLLVNRSVDLDRFRLYCHYDFSMSTVGKWIDAAVTKNVKELDLWLQDTIELPHCLVACGSLKELSLKLEGRGLRLRNVKAGFKALRVLCLRSAVVYDNEDVVNNFLQNCPLLEELSLYNCRIRKLSHLCISCPKLKELTIRKRYIDERDKCHSIKISCPNLVFLALIGHVPYNFSFEYCLDSLKQAEIDPKLINNTTTSVFPAISHVESLSIDLYFFSQCINDVRASALPNLKTLVLTTTITAFTMTEFNRILKYYSKLEFLKLIVIEELWRTEREVHEGDARDTFTCDMKTVEFFEFNGEKPKLTINLEERKRLQMRFSWGNRAAMYSYVNHYCCVNWL